MSRILIKLLVACACVGTLSAQDFQFFNRDVQVHGFASQGFVSTNGNNWLTMKSGDGLGSGQFTDFGGNVSIQVTDRLLVGVQVYDRDLGQLGKWHPQLDWAVASYKFKPWLRIRGGKVKTTMGLFNDTQDLDFLHTFALLPQSVYPTDVRDVTLAHTGLDVYGDIPVGEKGGTLSYTAFVGHRQDSPYGGYAYLIQSDGSHFDSMGGLQYGADLRWATPVKGLLVGISRLNESPTLKYDNGTSGVSTLNATSDWTNQFYAQYTWKKLQVDSEFRRYYVSALADGGPYGLQTDVRGWYVAATYKIAKRFTVGSYYSRYSIYVPDNYVIPPGNGHVYDKVVTLRYDVNRFFNVKVEGHFMDGYGMPDDFPNGFYSVDNLQGMKPNTNALVIKTSFKF
jgi:hypothetical protein